MKTDELLQALQTVLNRHPEGLAIPELQVRLYKEADYKLSYQEIENTFFRFPYAFREEDGRWRARRD